MPIRDLLQAQVEQMGKALGKVLVDVLDLKSTENINEGIEVCNEQLSTLLKIEINDLRALTFDDLRLFAKERNLTDGHLETLSQYFTELARQQQSVGIDSDSTFQKAIDLLTLADEISQTFSLSRMETKKKIRLSIKQ